MADILAASYDHIRESGKWMFRSFLTVRVIFSWVMWQRWRFILKR